MNENIVYSVETRDQTIAKIEYYISILSCEQLRLLSAFARGIVKEMEKKK